MPASWATRSSSAKIVEKVVRRPVVYSARNASPSLRARSALVTRALDFSRRTCVEVSCCCRLTCSRARSSAEPPQGLTASNAATILAATSRPNTARTRTRGSFRFTGTFSREDRLKLLDIIHAHAAAVQFVGLSGRQQAVRVHRAETRRSLQVFQQVDHRRGRFRSHGHVQRNLILPGHRRAYGHDPDVVRNHLLKVGENARPAYAFAVEQCVEEQAALQHLGVLGLAQNGILARLLGRESVNLRFQPRDLVTGFGDLHTFQVVQREEKNQQYDEEDAEGCGGDQDGAVAAEGLAGEIDGDSHDATTPLRSWLSSERSWLSSERSWLSSERSWLSSERSWLSSERSWLSSERSWLSSEPRALASGLVSVVTGHGPQISQQAGVIFAGRRQGRSYRLHVDAQFVLNLLARRFHALGEPAQQQAFGFGSDIVFDVNKCRVQVGGDLGDVVGMHFQAAHQLQPAVAQHHHGEHASGDLGHHGDAAVLDQVESGQRRCSHQAGIHSRGAERRFVAGDYFERRHHHHHVEFLAFRRLHKVADGGRFHIERNALFDAKANERKLLLGVRREIVEVQDRDSPAIVWQDERYIAALAISVLGRQFTHRDRQLVGQDDVVLQRGDGQHAGLQGAKVELRFGG